MVMPDSKALGTFLRCCLHHIMGEPLSKVPPQLQTPVRGLSLMKKKLVPVIQLVAWWLARDRGCRRCFSFFFLGRAKRRIHLLLLRWANSKLGSPRGGSEESECERDRQDRDKQTQRKFTKETKNTTTTKNNKTIECVLQLPDPQNLDRVSG